MTTAHRFTIAFSLILGLQTFSTPGLCEIYRSVDKHGNITFSDQPSKQSEAVKLPQVNTQPFPKGQAPSPTTPPAATGQGYDSLTIVSPQDQATIPTGIRSITVGVLSQPPLASEHRVQLYLNGEPYKSPHRSGNLSLTDLARGEHQVSAAIVNEKGKPLLTTSPITIFVKRKSILAP